MKKLLLCFAAFLCGSSLNAQEDNPAIIISTSGRVELLSEGKPEAQPVLAGALAKNTGQLKLANGSKATVYCNGQFKEVSGEQMATLSSLCGPGMASQKLDADLDFSEKLMAALEMVAVDQKRGDGWTNAVGDPKKLGDGWGTAVGDPKKLGDGWGSAVGDPKKLGDGWGNAVGDPKKLGDGWGGKGSSIRLIMPFGKVNADETTFFWSKPANTDPYKFEIKNIKGKVIYRAMAKDTFLVVNLKKLKLDTAQIYQWKVFVKGKKGMESNVLQFEIGKKEDWATVQQKSSSSPLVNRTNDPVLRSIVEAVVLENNEWFYAAHQSYAKLAQKNPDSLVRMMHAAFWMRYGFKLNAIKAARG